MTNFDLISISLNLDPPLLQRIADQPGGRFDAQLLAQVQPMRFDGTYADIELLGNALVAVALRDQDENLAFALGQARRYRSSDYEDCARLPAIIPLGAFCGAVG